MSDYLFTNDYWEPVHPDTFTKYLSRLYDENGFPHHFHLHTLRHYFISTLLHNGVDKQTVAELAGHGDTSFLERTYCHPQMELKQQASGRLTNTLFYPDRVEKVQENVAVFYIVPEKKKIVVGEVKDFSFAKNPYEMDQEYQRIFVDGDKPCYMTKHKRRADWIKNHMEDVKQHFNLPDGKWSVKTVMFVSEEIVSNAFYHKGEKIIVYSEISEKNVKAV